MTKKKSLDINVNEQATASALANSSPIMIENSDNLLNETFVDSIESTSPIAVMPPPAKPPHLNDESVSSSSSTEINSPPAKPPRHFSLYNNDEDDGLIQQTDSAVKKVLNLVDTFGMISDNDNDMNILRQTSPVPIYIQQASSKSELNSQTSTDSQTFHTFTVDPARTPLSSNSSLITKALDESVAIDSHLSMSSPSSDLSFLSNNKSAEIKSNDNSTPIGVIQLSAKLTDNIFEEIKEELKKDDISTNLSTVINNDRQNLLDKLSTQSKTTNNAFHDNIPSLSQSMETIHTSSSSIQSTSRPLTFLPLDSGSNTIKAFSPLINIAKARPTLNVTTSVTVASSSPAETSSSTTTMTTTRADVNSDDEEQLNSTSTLIPNSSIASDRSRFVQTSSKGSSFDSTDTNPFENITSQQVNTGAATPARSLLSDYDNLRGSYESLNDDAQQAPSLPSPPSALSETMPSMPTTTTTSMSTIYESLDTIPSTSTATFETARSTLNNDNASNVVAETKRKNSDISDEELVESHGIETPVLTSVNSFRFSKGRIASHRIAS